MKDAKPGTYGYNKEYAQKWDAKFDKLLLRLPAGQKAVWQDHAAAQGESMNQYIIKAVQNRMDAERKG